MKWTKINIIKNDNAINKLITTNSINKTIKIINIKLT